MLDSTLIHSAADLILGSRCPGCSAPTLGLCALCRAAILAEPPVRVTRPQPRFPGTVVAGTYSGQLRQVIVAAKERRSLGQLPLLCDLLTRAACLRLRELDVVAVPVVLVPVPTAIAHIRTRGLDLTATLAHGTSRRLRRLGVPASLRRSLVLARTPQDQAGLGVTARATNVSGAFALHDRLLGTVLLVDDVVTTGATLSEAARACRAAGCEPAGAIAVAGTQKRGGVR